LDGESGLMEQASGVFVPGFHTMPDVFKMGRSYPIASDCFDE
jgi:hypothetical protein